MIRKARAPETSVSKRHQSPGYVDVNTQFVITGGGGSGTVIIPTVVPGVITALTITSFGSGYVTTLTITITSGITGTSNIVAGSGYTNGIYPLVVTGGVYY